MRWERLNLSREVSEGEKSVGPGNRWGHTCNSVRGGELLYVFGGYGKDNCQTNDVFVFDTIKKTWSNPVLKGNPPSPRDSHSCTTVGNNLFIFGGTDGRKPLQDLYILDTASNEWVSPTLSGERPEPREGHSAALIGKLIFIFGGCGKSRDSSNEIYYNDVYILDTETLGWRRPVTSGKKPSARDSHTLSSWKNKIVVVAGEDASDYYLSDVHILDTDTLGWTELSTNGEKLPPRAGHCTVSLGHNLFVFGGFTDERNLYDDLHMLSLDTGTWTKVFASGPGPGPSSRFSVAGDCLDTRKGVLVFIGGCNKELEALDDMYYLYTDIVMENGKDESRPEKLSLRKELKRKCQEDQQIPACLPAKIVPHMHQIPISSSYGQTDRKDSPLYELRPCQQQIFEAKVTEVFHYGYTIETNINGKPLRGIVFSYKPGFAHAANSYLNKKSRGDDDKLNANNKSDLEVATQNLQEVVGHNKSSELEVAAQNLHEVVDHNKSRLENFSHIPREAIDHNIQNGDNHARESTSQTTPVEITAASSDSIPINMSLPNMASINSETRSLPPSSIDQSRHEHPNGETSKEMSASAQRQVADYPASNTKEDIKN